MNSTRLVLVLDSPSLLIRSVVTLLTEVAVSREALTRMPMLTLDYSHSHPHMKSWKICAATSSFLLTSLPISTSFSLSRSEVRCFQWSLVWEALIHLELHHQAVIIFSMLAQIYQRL